MAQRYLLPTLPPLGRTELTGDLAHHLGRVLRVQVGERVRLGDGVGGCAEATVLAVDRASVVVDVAIVTRRARIRPQVTLAFACPRPARADWLIEHGTEVGVAAFQPIWSERSRPQKLRLDRWRKIAHAAVGQCDRDWAPTLLEPVELGDWLAGERPPRSLLADAAGELLTATAGDGGRDDAALLVGPEGGFTDLEVQRAVDAGLRRVRFAAHTLRTETAALVGAALLLCDAREASD